MTMYEFNIMVEALQLRQVDELRDRAEQAFLNMRATAKDRKGRPIYKSFQKFFDYDGALRKVKKPVEDKERIRTIGKMLYGGD